MESTSPPNDVHEEKQAQKADRDVEHPPTTDTAESPSLENSKDLNRRRSFVDICTFGVIADPWRQKPWGARVSVILHDPLFQGHLLNRSLDCYMS